MAGFFSKHFLTAVGTEPISKLFDIKKSSKQEV
jgi:hypothetical protein